MPVETSLSLIPALPRSKSDFFEIFGHRIPYLIGFTLISKKQSTTYIAFHKDSDAFVHK